MTDENHANRRIHSRVAQKGYIKVIVVAAPEAPTLEGKVFQCTTRDLSSGGLKMVVHTAVPIGSRVRLHVVFTEPAAEFEHLARVVWSAVNDEDVIQTYSVGVEFCGTHGKKDHAWSDLLEARMLGSNGSSPAA
jgi:c-di-GMP-binding flagellar brake protein YcgR